MSSQQVSRRSVTRGAAWSVPLVAVGVAAPAFAASPGAGAVVGLLGGCRCGTGGGSTKTYRLDVTFLNASAFTFAITSPAITVTGSPGGSPTLISPNGDVPPGGATLQYTFTQGNSATSDVVTFAYTSTNTTTSASTSGTITATVNWSTCTNACVG